jgi:hypothetical protein
MPWVSEHVGAGGRRYRLPGVYRRLLREKCVFENTARSAGLDCGRFKDLATLESPA